MFSNIEIAFASKSLKELKKAYYIFFFMQWEKVTNIAIELLKFAMFLRLPTNWIIKPTVFAQFCGGESLNECKLTISSLAQHSVYSILDYAVERELNPVKQTINCKMFSSLIEYDFQSQEVSFSVVKLSAFVNIELLELKSKGQALDASQQANWEIFVNRVEGLFSLAASYQISLMIDAEESWIQPAIDQLVMEGMKKYNKETTVIFQTYQLYLKAKYHQLRVDIENAKNEGFKLGIKLVRGAYLEKEIAYHKKKCLEIPVFESKQETDTHFNKALKMCVENISVLSICCASHNEYSNEYLVNLLKENNLITNQSVSFAQLYGMGDHITFNLAAQGMLAMKYVPFGKVNQAMPYLIRRAKENKSINGQLSREFALIKAELTRRKIT
jgi:proline dehydrogenase